VPNIVEQPGFDAWNVLGPSPWPGESSAIRPDLLDHATHDPRVFAYLPDASEPELQAFATQSTRSASSASRVNIGQWSESMSMQLQSRADVLWAGELPTRSPPHRGHISQEGSEGTEDRRLRTLHGRPFRAQQLPSSCRGRWR
jgi:hypothetical protein